MTGSMSALDADTTSRAERLTMDICRLLRCPHCSAEMTLHGEELICANAICGDMFPVVDGVPILIDESASVFSIAKIRSGRLATTGTLSAGARIARRLVPETSANLVAVRNYDQFSHLLQRLHPRPRVLTVGGAITGKGLSRLLEEGSIEFIETDVSLGPRTDIVCDAHNLPFADGSFDGVIAQAVLEHVVDPYRCVDEMYRVLKADGLVYAETPFMQQVHAGAYDFTRFSHLGHRRLFRRFEEITSGAVAGPGTVLAWAYQFFLLSFAERAPARAFMKAASRLTSFWLKYFDQYLLQKPGALDAASAYYFLGRKSTRVFTDREVIAMYRGAE